MRRLRPALVAVALALAAAGSSPAPAPAREQVAAATWTRAVSLTGDGTGRVYSVDETSGVADGHIDCQIVRGVFTSDSKCSYTSADFTFEYYVSPAPGNEVCDFLDCSTSSSLYSWQTATSEQRAYQFLPLAYQLTVKLGGTGSGGVFGTPSVINCGEMCGASLEYGTAMLLTAIPNSGSTFTNWKGACAGQPADCLISIIADTTTTAVFAQIVTPSPPPTRTPSPTRTPPPTPRPTAPPTRSPTAVPTAPPAATATATPATSTSPAETAVATVSAAPSGSAAPSASPVAAAGSAAPGAGSPAPSFDAPPATATTPVADSPIMLILAAGILGAFLALVVIGAVGLGMRRRRQMP